MLQAKQIGERNSLMPRINKDAAKRFVRNGLWEPKQKRHKSIEERIEKSGKSPPT
jgi:exosome complex protein LRP1